MWVLKQQDHSVVLIHECECYYIHKWLAEPRYYKLDFVIVYFIKQAMVEKEKQIKNINSLLTNWLVHMNQFRWPLQDLLNCKMVPIQ